jgi:Fe-S-cluster containining protein
VKPPRQTITVVSDCDSCGACCRFVTTPPFRRVFDGEGEDAWERLRRERPELQQEILEYERALRSSGAPFYGTPCLWYDPDSAQCRHYEYRPAACRAFAVGSPDCLDARRRAGVPEEKGAVPR